jgi:hypothetical protein
MTELQTVKFAVTKKRLWIDCVSPTVELCFRNFESPDFSVSLG